MKWKKLALILGMCASLTSPVLAASAFDQVTPQDWAYKALQTLEKHGAITDTRGIDLGTASYTRYQLVPLISYAVNHRETMNESDKMLAIRLYSEYRDDILNYDRNQEEAEKRGLVTQPVEKALTEEQIQERMKAFKVDDSAVTVHGDTRVRFMNTAGNGHKADTRTRVEFVIGGSTSEAVPAALQPKEVIDMSADNGEEVAKAQQAQVPTIKMSKQQARQAKLAAKAQAKQEARLAKQQAKEAKEKAKEEAQAKAQEERAAKAAAKAQAKQEAQLAKQQAKEAKEKAKAQAQAKAQEERAAKAAAKAQAKQEAQLAKQQAKEAKEKAKEEAQAKAQEERAAKAAAKAEVKQEAAGAKTEEAAPPALNVTEGSGPVPGLS